MLWKRAAPQLHLTTEMFDYEVTIRLSDCRDAFVYTIARAGRELESCEVDAAEEVVTPGYYGGSEAMD
jgi:hypothetical protein